MKQTIHLLRHAETKRDPNRDVATWELSERGKSQVKTIAESKVFDHVEDVFCSEEAKAISTAEPIAMKLGLSITSLPELDELDRGSQYISTDEEYYATVEEVLSNPDAHIRGWESSTNALRRFKSGLKRVCTESLAAEILIVSHGLVLSLLFASLLKRSDIFSRWKRLDFCSWGTIQGQQVVKDILDNVR